MPGLRISWWTWPPGSRTFPLPPLAPPLSTTPVRPPFFFFFFVEESSTEPHWLFLSSPPPPPVAAVGPRRRLGVPGRRFAPVQGPIRGWWQADGCRKNAFERKCSRFDPIPFFVLSLAGSGNAVSSGNLRGALLSLVEQAGAVLASKVGLFRFLESELRSHGLAMPVAVLDGRRLRRRWLQRGQ